tara:strand:+ start:1163 stop:2494 length:1332 start_codon:yes stop_codon:yes gene_type:complete
MEKKTGLQLPDNYTAYKKVKGILPNKGDALNKNRIISEIKKLAKNNSIPFENLICDYLYCAMDIADVDGEYFFDEVFGEEIKRINEWKHTFFYFSIKGLSDILAIGFPKDTTTFLDSMLGKIHLYSRYDIPILLTGETGTSKQSVAKALHDLSDRKGKFVNANCVALSEGIIESELFGHKKGAFTGANSDKVGLIEYAENGTFFLDELGKLPDYLQAKLLKAIEEQEVVRSGTNDPIKINVRFIAAAQPKDIEKDKIIPDLLFRLGYPLCIRLSSLNERLNVVPKLVLKNSLKEALKSMNLNEYFSINNNAINEFKRYTFEGHYRELENIFRIAVISAKFNKRNEILPEDLDFPTKKDYSELPAHEKTTYKNIKLKDILTHGEERKSEIVKAKIEEVYKDGKNIKNVLKSEGIKTESEYQTINNKFKDLLGKDTLKQLRKKYK